MSPIAAARHAVEGNLRRFVAVAASALLVAWLAWLLLAAPADIVAAAQPRAWWLAVAVAAALGCALNLLVIFGNQSPTSSVRRAVDRVLSRAWADRTRIRRWAWVPPEFCLVLIPLLVCYGVLATVGPGGGVVDLRHGWVGSMTLIAATLFVGARVSLGWSLVYTAAVAIARISTYGYATGAIVREAVLVVVHGYLYALVCVMAVAYIRRAARALDSRITARTAEDAATTVEVARACEHARGENLVLHRVVPGLQRTAHAESPAEREGVRREAQELLCGLEALGGVRTPADLPQDPPTVLAGVLTGAVHRISPLIQIHTHLPRSSGVPLVVRDHLVHSLLRVLRPVVPTEEDGDFVRVDVHADEDGVHVDVVTLPGFAFDARLRESAGDVERTMAALPGGSVTYERVHRSRDAAAPMRVGLDWLDREPAVLARRGMPRRTGFFAFRSRPDRTERDPEVADQFLVASVLTESEPRRNAVVLAALAMLTLTSLAFLNRGVVSNVALDAALHVLALAIAITAVLASFRLTPGAPLRRIALYVLCAYTVVVLAAGLSNLRDPAGVMIEVEYWPANMGLMVALFLAASGSGWLALLTSGLQFAVLATWGLLLGLESWVLTGGGLYAFLATLVTVLLVERSTAQMQAIALVRRATRASAVVDVHDRTVARTRRETSRHLDTTVRPFLAQQATGFPPTTATRLRAGLLAAALQDDLRAPIFRDTTVGRAAADARARGVEVDLLDEGALDGGEERLRRRVVELVTQALEAAVDGSVHVCVAAPGRDHLVTITTVPRAEEQRRTTVLSDGSVDYDGVHVRPPWR